jgi:hypothetical protein
MRETEYETVLNDVKVNNWMKMGWFQGPLKYEHENHDILILQDTDDMSTNK